ncbi:hypothetical protein ACFQL9_12990 [Halobaculum lipolyticum]|uniref:Uncharacterized protein n=1 Tax=Halobaculum lipolyticum TaxID=3032001 RepID=A0ABD5WBB8_9EURY
MTATHDIRQTEARTDELVSFTTYWDDRDGDTVFCISFDQIDPASWSEETAGAIFDMCKHFALTQNAPTLKIQAVTELAFAEVAVANDFLIDTVEQIATWTSGREIDQVETLIEAHLHIESADGDAPCGCVLTEP